MSRKLGPAAPSLVDDGRVRFGTFDVPFERVNLLDADAYSLPLPRAIKAARLKEWQAFQLSTPRYFVCFALFNAKTLALAQVKIYDRQAKQKVLFEKKVVPWAFDVADGLMDSCTEYRSQGVSLRFRNRLSDGQLEIQVEIAAGKRWPSLRANVVADASAATPQVVSIPFADNRGMYSHKSLMPATGSLNIDGNEVSLEDAFIFMDDHKGYYPLEMKWDWLTAGGRLDDGRIAGFNLTRNQSLDQDRFNENCIWVAGQRTLLPPVKFDREDTGNAERWTVRDDAGRVDVTFRVDMPSRIDINAVVIRSKYSGPYGTLQGTIALDDASRIHVDGWFGMGEDFYLRC